MGVGILVASHLFGQKARHSEIKDSPYECGLASEVGGETRYAKGKIKDSPYECGLASDTGGETRYSVKFYITAMLFILFDIDVVFLIPWVLTHRDLVAAGIPILGPMMFFTFILVIGLIYELKSGALKWEK